MFFGLFFFVSIVVNSANCEEPFNLSAKDVKDIKRVEAYLNGITTLSTRFIQVSSNGGYAEGKLHISRPGLMRINYAPPTKIEIVSNGVSLIYHDKELEQVSHIDLIDTPANILLQKNILLTKGQLQVNKVTRSPGIIRINVTKEDDPQEGKITLVFSDKPLKLKKWIITDAQNIETTISLLRSHFGITINPKIFIFNDPDYEFFQGG